MDSMFICVFHVEVGIACNMWGIMFVKAMKPVLANFEKRWISKFFQTNFKISKKINFVPNIWKQHVKGPTFRVSAIFEKNPISGYF